MKNLNVLVVIGVLSSCWPAIAEDDTKQAEDGAERVCIMSRNVHTFDALSDKHVFVEERRNHYYVLTMSRQCVGLRNANMIGLKSTTSRICADRVGSEILYRDMGSRRTCRIDTIVPVANKDDARALVREELEHDKYKKSEEKED